MVINKSPSTTVSTTISLSHFTPRPRDVYAFSGFANHDRARVPAAGRGTYSFAPYSATLLVISGNVTQAPAVEWDLNPDATMVPAGGSVARFPQIVSGTGTATLNSQQSDNGITVTLTEPTSLCRPRAAVGDPDRFRRRHSRLLPLHCDWHRQHRHAADTGRMDRGGKSGGDGDKDRGQRDRLLLTLTATFNVGSSGATPQGASILFTTTGGTLSDTGSSGLACNSTTTACIATTDSSGNATLTLTLPIGTGKVTVTAEGPFPLGHPVK